MRKYVVLVVVLVCAAYAVWRNTTGFKGEKPPILPISFHTFGQYQDRGNLIGIQPFMVPSDYASEQSFGDQLERYLSAALQRGVINKKSIVVFPEYLGTWLVVMNEKNAVYTTDRTTDALTYLVLRHPLDFLTHYIHASETEKDRAAIFRTKAAEMAFAYENAFSKLAGKYHVTIVAGSIVLPDPVIDAAGHLKIHPSKDLYNTAVVFDTEGKILAPLVKKIFPILEEKGFVCPGPKDQNPVFDLPAGKLGVLICADSWYPEVYERLQNAGAELIAIPSDVSPEGTRDAPWGGYNPGPFPDDINRSDVGKLTEAAAWKKYSMGGRAPNHKVRFGMNVFLRGKLWDLGSAGHTLFLQQGEIKEGTDEGAAITNVWINKSNQ